MAYQLEGNIEALRIYEYLIKILGSSDLNDYYLLIDKQGNQRAQRVSLASLLSFSGSTFYDDIFKLISRADDDELTFSLVNLTTNRSVSWPDISGLIAVNGMLEAFKFGGQATGGSYTASFAATASFNLNNGNSQQMTLTGNLTSLELTNEVNGGSYLIYLIQDATGSRTIPTPDSSFGNKTDNSVDFVTASNAVNLINVNVRPDGTTYYTIETYTP